MYHLARYNRSNVAKPVTPHLLHGCVGFFYLVVINNLIHNILKAFIFFVLFYFSIWKLLFVLLFLLHQNHKNTEMPLYVIGQIKFFIGVKFTKTLNLNSKSIRNLRVLIPQCWKGPYLVKCSEILQLKLLINLYMPSRSNLHTFKIHQFFMTQLIEIILTCHFTTSLQPSEGY